jgi:hypothetical protein
MLTGSQQIIETRQLHERAQRCRELADTALTEEGRSILCEIAQRYEREASTPVDDRMPAPAIEAA